MEREKDGGLFPHPPLPDPLGPPRVIDRERDTGEQRREQRLRRELETVKVRVDRRSILHLQGIFAGLIEPKGEHDFIRYEGIPESWVVEKALQLAAFLFHQTPSLDDIRDELREMIDAGQLADEASGFTDLDDD